MKLISIVWLTCLIILVYSCNEQKYAGSYSSVSESGDSCEELIVEVNIIGKVSAQYRSWYCGEGGPAPEFEQLSNVSIKKGTLRGKTPGGYEVVWNLQREESQL